MSIKNLKNLFIFFIILVISSCAGEPIRVDPLLSLDAKPSWFKTSKRFTHINAGKLTSKYIVHPFFDLRPLMAKKDQGVNIVALTEQDSDYEYQLDLKSGKAYMSRQYCKERDVWESYKGTIHKPPFLTGFVPRVLDQRGHPQKVIVFGAKHYFPKKDITYQQSYRVRIVGGVIEQFCPKYPCTLKNRWLSRMILIAVNPNDPKFKNVVQMEELKKRIEWDSVRAFLENASGRNISSIDPLPSFRIIGKYGPNEAMTFVRKQSHFFKDKEIKKMQKSCYKLYDFLWSWIKSIRRYSKLPKEKNEEDLIDLKGEEFADFMLRVTGQFKKRFMLCQKYVREGSINDEIERVWFFAYLHAYFSLENMGEVFSCKYKSWLENPYLVTGRRIFDPLKEIEFCDTKDFNAAFYKSLGAHSARRGSFREHYRYITYDNRDGGSHQKLYSWVYDNAQHQSCIDKKLQQQLKIFPIDVDWKSF